MAKEKCVQCGEVKTIVAKGLCTTCYPKSRKGILTHETKDKILETETHFREPKKIKLQFEVDVSVNIINVKVVEF